MNAELIKYAEANLEPVKAVEEFNAHLVRQYQPLFRVEVGGPFSDMNPATVLREIDPLIWQMELNRFCRKNCYCKIGQHYYDWLDAEDAGSEVIAMINNRIHELRNKQTHGDPHEFETFAIQIANLQSEQDEIRSLTA
jgi:hypothetical protein